jgi:hypothetical protein
MNYKLKQGFVRKARQILNGALVFTMNAMAILVAEGTAASFGSAFQQQSEFFLFSFYVVEGKMADLQIQQLTHHGKHLN